MFTGDGLQISRETYSRLKPETIEDILRSMGLDPPGARVKTGGQPAYDSADGLVRFTDREWRKFLEGVRPKTREALEAVADLGPRYSFEALLQRLRRSKTFGPKLTSSGLSRVQGGLTKRTRTIAQTDEELYRAANWKDGEDYIVEWNPSTHAALRRVLGKEA